MFRKLFITFLASLLFFATVVPAPAQEQVPNAPLQRYIVVVPQDARESLPAGLIPIQARPSSERAVDFFLDGYFVWDENESGPLPGNLKSMAFLDSQWEEPQLVTYSSEGEVIPVQVIESGQEPCVLPFENWGIKKTGVGGAIINLNPTTHITVTIAVVDSGAEINHPCFQDRVVKGWNFADNTGDVKDENGHGTHVSGLILQACPGCTVVMYKAFSNRNGGGPITIALSIVQAVAYGADAISISLNGPDASGVVCSAVSLAVRAGIPVFVAAGNFGKEIEGVPASCPGVIAVSATEQFDGYTDWSSYPGLYLDPSIFAVAGPGKDIISTYPCGFNRGCYAVASGTSMATPMAAGAAALLMERGYFPSIDIEVLLGLAVNGYHLTMNFKRVELGGTYGDGESILPQILNPTAYPPVVLQDGGNLKLCFNTGDAPVVKAGATVNIQSTDYREDPYEVEVNFSLEQEADSADVLAALSRWCGLLAFEKNDFYDLKGSVSFLVESAGGSWNADAPWGIAQRGAHGAYVPGSLECWRSDRFCTFLPNLVREWDW